LKIKILNVLQYPSYNGPANTCLEIDAQLKGSGIDVQNLIPTGAEDLKTRFSERSVSYCEADLSRLRISLNPRVQYRVFMDFWKTVSNIRSVIKENAIDVVIVCGMENPHAAIAAKLEGKKVIGQVLGLGIPRFVRPLIGLWTRLTCDVGMTPGSNLTKYFPGYLPVDKNVSFFPPIDFCVYKYKGKNHQFASEYGIDTERPVIGTVGNINPAKDYVTFVKSCARIKKLNPGTQFLIKGNVLESQLSLFENLKALANQNNLIDNRDIFFVRDEKDSSAALSLMDCYLQTSIGEGVSTALLEAMSMERLVVATNVGGTSDVIQDGQNGVLVNPRDHVFISNVVSNLLKDDGKVENMSSQARRFVLQNTSVEACASAYLKAIDMANEG